MLFASVVAAAVGLLSAPVAASPIESRDVLADLQVQAMDALKLGEAESGSASRLGSCNIFNARYRRDWEALSAQEKKSYIGAVQCLQKLPSKSDPELFPGARSRYDDFVAVHINLTSTIHATGNFLTWHRYFVWSYEEALQKECSYKGTQPYWNWVKYQDDLTKSPLFDGSDTSLGGDGAFFQHNGSFGGAGTIHLPSGKGGGCIQSGPFVNMSVNLGPVRPGMNGMVAGPNGGLGYNPRCLSRDLSSYIMTNWMTNENLLNMTIGRSSGNIKDFQEELQGRFEDRFLGMHGAGHYAVGGEAADLFSSVNDPSFFFHHAMVDRVYWLWQTLHPWNAFEIAGTMTIGNNPPSRNATVEDELIMGVNGETRKIKELLNTIGGTPLCYVYL
ncbi:FAD-binding domain-containing protein [Colletotrichum sojae]|uniref:FAD-binding domain-containing protein n=1 Tax=Colletotrichum sojae TaxID=2175907 RepID=A0A8H6IQ64_9PEZI|nr:FAD-binding domain-containing protein [Colletotrichum sojae]